MFKIHTKYELINSYKITHNSYRNSMFIFVLFSINMTFSKFTNISGKTKLRSKLIVINEIFTILYSTKNNRFGTFSKYLKIMHYIEFKD